MLVEIFIPILLKFQDDKVVLKKNEISAINDRLEDNLQKSKSKYSEISGFNYSLKDEDLEEFNHAIEAIDDCTIDELSIHLYYYHHRIIIRYSFQLSNEGKLRKVRRLINENYKKVIYNYIVEAINSLVQRGQINADAKVLGYYSYLLIFVPKKVLKLNKIATRLQTLTFRIIESSRNIFVYGYTHHVRISIPSTIVYYENEIGTDTKMDLINSIYQYCLYLKKIKDIKNNVYMDKVSFDQEAQKENNVIDEEQLMQLWEFLMDNLGGKINDYHVHQISKENFYLAILAFIISMASFFISTVF